MRSGFLQQIADSLKFAIDGAVHSGKTLAAAYASIGLRDQAARAATTTTLAVVLAVFIGCAIHLQEVWLAAISAFMTTNPQSTARGLQRILGTVVGAMLAMMLVGWLSDDLVACCLVLFVVIVVGSIGFNVSPLGYAWLFVCITFGMVLLSSLPNP